MNKKLMFSSFSEDEINSLKEVIINSLSKELLDKQVVSNEFYAKQLAQTATENIFNENEK